MNLKMPLTVNIFFQSSWVVEIIKLHKFKKILNNQSKFFFQDVLKIDIFI